MKKGYVLIVMFLIFITFLLCLPNLISAVDKDEEFISGILIYDEKPVNKMKLASDSFAKEKADREKEIKALSKEAEIKYNYHIFDGSLIKIPKKDLSKLSKIKNAKFYPVRKLKLTLHESVPQINADILHSIGLNGTGITVAVTDTGVDYNHAALVGKINPSNASQCYAFINNGEETNDCFDVHGHGTHVFGTIASNDSYYTGVAPGANMMAIRIFNVGGAGYDPDLVRAIEYAVDNGADIISMSVVTVVDTDVCLVDPSVPCTCYDAVTSIASDNAVDAGVIMIGGSGNEYRLDGVEAPACSNKTIAVGAVDKYEDYAEFSNGGYDLDVVAPGVGIYSTILGGGFAGPDWSGTSMATPHVSGVVALLLQADSSLTPEQMKNLLRLTAVDLGNPGFDIYYGYGRVDAYNAYDELINPYPRYIDAKTCKDANCLEETKFFESDDLIYIKTEITDLIWREIPGLGVNAKIYFNDILQETIPLIAQGSGIYSGSFNATGGSEGVYNLTINASNINGQLAESSQFHVYSGSGVSAYYMDFGSLDYIIENQHLISVFNKGQVEGAFKYLIQKETLVSYNFLESAQGTSRGGIHSTFPLNVNYTASDLGENLVEADINYNIIAITGVGYEPPLNNTPYSCGAPCHICSDRVLTGDCQRDTCSIIDEYIENLQTNGSVFAPGSTISVTVSYRCSDSFSDVDALSISYNSGGGWSVVKCYDFYSMEPEGCAYYGGGMHSTTINLTLSGNPGAHYIRASMSYGGTCPYTCASSGDGDNDDINITVAQEILVGEDSADLNIKIKNESDYLIYKLDNFNNNFPNFFFSDVIGTLGNFNDDKYHLQNGTDDLITGLIANLWRDYNSDYVAVYDDSTSDNVNDNVLSWVRFNETSNVVFDKVGVLNENYKEGSRIKYQTTNAGAGDEVNYLLAFTKGSWQDVDDDMGNISLGIYPVSFYNFKCVNGETKLCPLQLGVCIGSNQTCTNEKWPGCSIQNYNSTGKYEINEVTCDGLDNDCDGVIDEGCAILDSDNDGVINVWDDCPDTPPNSLVNNRGCPGNCSGSGLIGDVNNDCVVDILDLSTVGFHFGNAC